MDHREMLLPSQPTQNRHHQGQVSNQARHRPRLDPREAQERHRAALARPPSLQKVHPRANPRLRAQVLVL